MKLYSVFAGRPEYGACLVLAKSAQRARVVAWGRGKGDASDFTDEFIALRARLALGSPPVFQSGSWTDSEQIVRDAFCLRQAGFWEDDRRDCPNCGLAPFATLPESQLCPECAQCAECGCDDLCTRKKRAGARDNRASWTDR